MLDYSTFLGGSDFDAGAAVAVDGSGKAYLTGDTWSNDLPVTVGVLQASHAGGYHDAFVAKLDPNAAGASSLMYLTYLGGGSLDQGWAIAVDGAGSAYVAGDSASANFPTVNPFQATCSTCSFGSGDAFLAKLNADATALDYSSYLGGSAPESGMGVAVDAQGHAYVVGGTRSIDFPVRAALQPNFGGGYNDGFVALFDPNSSGAASLPYSGYLGGGAVGPYGHDHSTGVALDTAGSLWVAGQTASIDFPAVDAFDPTYNGGQDCFLARFSNLPGSDLIFADGFEAGPPPGPASGKPGTLALEPHP